MGIGGNCGFLMWYQARVRELTSTPVFMSALVQAPLLKVSVGRKAKTLIITSNAKNLLAAKNVLFAEAGVKVGSQRYVILGVDDLRGFEPIAKPELGPIDVEPPRFTRGVRTGAGPPRHVDIPHPAEAP